jgi:kinesin family protein C1
MELLKTKDATASSIAGGLNKDMKYDFEFDRVFGPDAGQAEVFTELSQLVQSALDGYNVCVFAYGQTGSGKTFTMEGGEDAEADEAQAGMIPRTIQQIFVAQDKLKAKSWIYKLQASFLEIYNEEIRDLLAVEKNLKYDIKTTESKDLHVTNLRTEEVLSEAQVASLLRRAGKARAQAKTLCNERSSRSHSVFILKIDGHNTSSLETCSGVLNLVSASVS